MEKLILNKLVKIKEDLKNRGQNMHFSSLIKLKIPTQVNIKKLAKFTNKKIPDDIISFYLKCPPISLRFGYYNSNQKTKFLIQGCCELLDIEDVIEKIQYFKRKPNYGGVNYLNNKYVPLADLGDEHLVVMEFKDNKTILHLLMPDGQMFFLDTSLEAYYEKVLSTRGMFLWEAYIAPDITEEFLEKNYDGFFENMEHLFPEVDLSTFLHRDRTKGINSINNDLSNYQYIEKFYSTFDQYIRSQFVATSSIFPSETVKHGLGRLSLIRSIELVKTGKLPSAYRALMLYFGLTGLKLQWYNKHDKNISGNFYLWGLYETFRNEENDSFTNDALLHLNLKKEDYPELENVYIFFQQDETLVGFYMVEEGVAELCIIDSEEKAITKLDWGITDFETFFEELLNTRGLSNWLNGDTDFGKSLKKAFKDVDLTRYS